MSFKNDYIIVSRIVSIEFEGYNFKKLLIMAIKKAISSID